MSFLSTDVSPTNKRNSESLGDSMICDDARWTDYGVDGSKKQENTNLIKNKSEIPPKNDAPSSEVQSICEPPRSKKRKLSSFDELIKNLDYGELYPKLRKLLFFLESDNNNVFFSLTNDYEVFFEMIVKDINILKSKSLDDEYRHISNELIEAAAGKMLFHVFEDRPEKVMVIKKVPIKDQSGNSTASSSCSSETSMLPSQTSTKVDTKDQSRSLLPPAISSGFKIHCLRTLLAFIKNDAIKTKEFPELSTDQAKFMQLLLGKDNKDNFDRNKEVYLYRQLVHAVKINELKYEFRINCNESSGGGKKSVVFEKVPVLLTSETAVNSDQTADKSNQSVVFKIPVHVSSKTTLNADQTAGKSKETMNPKTNVQIIDDPNTDAPKPDAPNPEFSKPDAPQSHGPKKDVLKPDTTKSNGPKIDMLKPDTTKSIDTKIDVLKPNTTKLNDTKIDLVKPNTTKSNGPKIDVLKPDTTKSNGRTMDLLKPDIPKSNCPKIFVPKQDASKSQDPMMDVPQTDAPESHGPKIEVLKPDALKAQAPKTSNSGAPTTERPQPDLAEPWFKKPKPPSLKKQKKENKIIKNAPKKFIEDTLNKILDFLLNVDMEKLVLVPKTKSELKFCRRCINWCSSGVDLSQFGEEFREIHCRITHLLCRINVQVTKRCQNAINLITRLKEVTYVKTPKLYVSGSEAKETSDGSESQSTPKKPKKVNVQNALQLAAMENIELEKVINLNQSLRSKKKDKKRKKAEKMKAKKSKGASSSSCSSRDSSRDRVKAAMAAAYVPRGAKVAKRPSSEISQTPKKTSLSRASADRLRHEKLREAMSVPVKSEKAMRMMLGMGWNGGALGPRGEGITEPIMPALEIPRGAGFGLISHRTQNSNPDTVPVPKKPKVPNPPTPFAPGSDIVVEKTKQLIREDVTFASIMKTTEPAKFKTNFEPSKPTTSKVELPTQARCSIGNQKLENDVEFGFLTDLKLGVPFRMELLQSVWDLINSDAPSKLLKYGGTISKSRKQFVKQALETLGAKKNPNLLNKGMFQKVEIPICQQIRNKYIATQIIVEAHFYCDFTAIALIKVPKKIKTPADLLKLPEKVNPPTPLENKENTATITDCNQIINTVSENTATITDYNQIINADNLESFIFSMNGRTHQTEVTMKNMQFRVLFLIHLLKFVKSFNEEYEVTFNKVLAKKEMTYMENVVEQINMRKKIGSSRAEAKFGDLIRQHVKDAFLSIIIYDHEYTTITLSKYFRFKRLNRPDNAVRRKAQATVNLDDFTSETLTEPKLNTYKPFDREIKYDIDKYKVSEHTNDVTETDNTQVSTENTTVDISDDESSEALPNSSELESYDSDDSSNNANAKAPKLLLAEKGVNISNFLHLCDKEKTNKAGSRTKSIINNDSASNVTENRNSKNNIGNGNVVIDNNDNQFIDMKRAGGNAQDTQKENNVDSEKAEYVVCVDDKEEKELKSAENSIQIDRKEIDLTKKLKEVEKNVANDDKINSYLKDACKDIGDPNVIVIEDSDSDNYCTESKAKDKIKNISKKLPSGDFKREIDVIIKDMKILNITEDSLEGINTEPVHGIVKDDSNAVINKDKSKAVINTNDSNTIIHLDDAADVINKDVSEGLIIQGESMTTFNTVESSKDKEISQIKEGISINPSDENIVNDDLVIKSDCDRIKKDNIVLSEEFCNTQSVKSSREQTAGTGSVFIYDKDSEIKNVRIGHTHHPFNKLSNEKIEKIQLHISNCIKLATELPLLKCHGVQNGSLYYTCHNKKTYDWLQNTIGVASYVKVFDIREVTKTAIKLCGYFDFDSNYLFKMLEMYNKEISTKEWVVEKTEKKGDDIIFIVKMDKFSIKFIQESDLSLFAGIDKVNFSLICE